MGTARPTRESPRVGARILVDLASLASRDGVGGVVRPPQQAHRTGIVRRGDLEAFDRRGGSRFRVTLRLLQ